MNSVQGKNRYGSAAKEVLSHQTNEDNPMRNWAYFVWNERSDEFVQRPKRKSGSKEWGTFCKDNCNIELQDTWTHTGFCREIHYIKRSHFILDCLIECLGNEYSKEYKFRSLKSMTTKILDRDHYGSLEDVRAEIDWYSLAALKTS